MLDEYSFQSELIGKLLMGYLWIAGGRKSLVWSRVPNSQNCVEIYFGLV